MPSVQDEIRIGPVLWDWWKVRLGSRGFLATSKEFFLEIWDFIRESTPERRRSRYGDADFDWDHRVDTTSATVTFRERLVGAFSSAYQPTEPEAFREMMNRLPISFPDFTFIDLGSGKGRTLLMASDFPFRRLVGVEQIPRLVQVADENVHKYHSPERKCFEVELLCADARNFTFPDEPLVLFLFNPFPEPILRQVMANLGESLRRSSRPAYVVYHNPVHEAVLQNCPSLTKMAELPHCAIYVGGG